MSFPTINIKATNITLNDELRQLLEQKLTPLEKFIRNDATDLKCDVELEKITDQHSGKIFRGEINLYVEGRLYRAEATEDQIEKAIDVIRNELKRELRKNQGKRKSLIRRGSMAIKNMLRFGR